MVQIGEVVEDEQEAADPIDGPLIGRLVTLERLQVHHAKDLWEEVKDQTDLWNYTFDGPYAAFEAFEDGVQSMSQSQQQFTYAVLVKGKAMGRISLTNLDKTNRVCQVGHILLSPSLQRTTEATECFHLLFQMAFQDMKLRRLEWKCDNLNIASKKAAQRLGFSYEGLFRKHMIRRGRNRDTAWHSITDDEWFGPVGQALEKWLHPNNFDIQGSQIESLQKMQASLEFFPVIEPDT